LDARDRLRLGNLAVDTCEVVIVGGGPAGSTCAWRLRQAGFDVVVVDKAVFPRNKVCAGWITPRVLDDLQIAPHEYCDRRTFQPITGFRVGVIGDDNVVEASYGRVVSFGIRRCEFDDYLLRRSGARLLLGAPVSGIRRSRAGWVVNETVSAPMLVGAGGHFCPVARMLNGARYQGRIVAAQELELLIDRRSCRVNGETPELYFAPDLTGYGWCLRKGEYVNVGLGRLDPRALPAQTAEFIHFLRTTGRIAIEPSACRWRGHAYQLSGSLSRRVVGDAVMLAGDAGALAYPHSGEGIRPAIESGLIAAAAIVEANGDYSHDRLEPYARRLQHRFGAGSLAHLLSRIIPTAISTGMSTALAPWLLDNSWFVRHVVLDRWFLHAREPALAPA
jgi:flavin-dependent dehydrogenase